MGESIPFSAVEELLRETAEEDILPYYQSLKNTDVEEKSPGDLVTVADKASEKRLAPRLLEFMPGSLVVGEEMVHEDEKVLDRFNQDSPVWVIDPLDGTGNFAAGKPTFAILVSLIQKGETLAGWIYDPIGDRMAVAERGGGCQLNGTSIHIEPAPDDPAMMHGGMSTKFLPDDLRATAVSALSAFSSVSTTMCAGQEYLSLLAGEKHYYLFYRTLPWDHSAGTLMVQEVGGCAKRLDGTLYQPVDGRKGLLMATDSETWRRVHSILLPSIDVVR